MVGRVIAPELARTGAGRLLGLTAYMLGLSVLWGAISTIVLPYLVGQAVPGEIKASALALVAGLQAVVAIVVQPLAGAASDRLPTRFGRRRPWLVIGVGVQFVCLIGLAFAGGYWAILLVMLLVELASNCAQGPYQALLPDTVPVARRGLASGLLGAAQLAGQVVGVAAAAAAIAAGAVGLAVFFAGGSVVLGMLATVASVPEPATALSGAGLARLRGAGDWLAHLAAPRRWLAPARAMVLEVWGRDILDQRDYLWVLASRLAILMATGALQPFILYYLQDSLGLGDQAGPAVTALAALVALVAVASAIPGGALTARWGRARMVAVSGLVGAVGAAAFAVAQSYGQLLLIVVPFGVAIGVFLSADWALLVDIVPHDEAGRYLGLSNTVTAGAGLLAIVTAGPLADLVNSARPGYGYRAIFVLAAVEFLIGAWCMRHVREPARPGAGNGGSIEAIVTAGRRPDESPT